MSTFAFAYHAALSIAIPGAAPRITSKPAQGEWLLLWLGTMTNTAEPPPINLAKVKIG
jgi:hypothetical protein